MDRFFNSKRQHMTNYLDIFKACRLCGSGGGYKMPIIQKLHNDDVIDVEAELKQKIRECVSIDVHPDDRMPPLICELCVDKVNDFYEFREMCRATNARVRASLGLPPQNLSQDVNEDCILGVSGPVFLSSNDDGKKKDKNKKKSSSSEKKSLRSREPTPPKILDRSSRRRHAESPVLPVSAKKSRYSSPSLSKSPVVDKKKHTPKATESLAVEAKRLRESRDLKTPEIKKGNLLQKQKVLLAQKAKERDAKSKVKAKEAVQRVKELKDAQKSKLAEQKSKDSALKKKQTSVAPTSASIKCEHCPETFFKQIEYKQHLNTLHTPLHTDDKLACTPCGEWFTSLREAETHHKWHKTSNTYYTCQRCSTDFKVLMGFTKHFQRNQCVPYNVVPDVKCNVCLDMFPTENWMLQHKCAGPPKDMCKRCLTAFQSRISLKKHERTCKGVIVPVNPNNPLLKALKPLSISVDRCDNLLVRIKTEPGLLSCIKQEPMDFEESTFHIKEEIKQEAEDYNDDYYDEPCQGGYSSEGSDSETDVPPGPHMVINPFARKNPTQVETLSIISLRSIFGGRLLNKRTKKKKKRNPKQELVHPAEIPSTDQTVFDSIVDNREGGETGGNVFDSLRECTVCGSAAHDNAQCSHSEGVGHHENVTEQVPLATGESDLSVGNDNYVAPDVENTNDVPTNEVAEDTENALSQIVKQTDGGWAEHLLDDHSSSIAIQTGVSSDLHGIQDKGAAHNNLDCNDPTTSNNKPSKSFVQGFALDPEVEALLMEDDVNNDISDAITIPDKLLASSIDDIIQQSETKLGASIDTNLDLSGTLQSTNVEDGLLESSLEESAVSEGIIHNEQTSNQVVSSVVDSAGENGLGKDGYDADNHKKCEDVLDLISDSGDDCNIVESPDKTKLTEETFDEKKQPTGSPQEMEKAAEENGSNVTNTMPMTSSPGVNPSLNEGGPSDELLVEEKQIDAKTLLTNKDILLAEDKQIDAETFLTSKDESLTEDKQIDAGTLLTSKDELLAEDKQIDPETLLTSKDKLLAEDKEIDAETLLTSNDELLAEDKQIDEETLLTSKDDGVVIDTEISQQDEDILLGKDDAQDVPFGIDQDLEKISDDDFDMD